MNITKKKNSVTVVDNGIVLFDGTEEQFVDIFVSLKTISEAIKTDIEAGLINEQELFDYELYKEIAEKFGN